ncbi:type 4a pilus biogenesis protein PilO [Candidatus Microgenomates bacterium]|nr:type 4a pilus biogenesis protein PilO [Candidatus Microgenomates bacterium]
MEIKNTKHLIEEELMKRRYNRYYTWIGPLLKKPQTRAYTFLILSIFTVAFFVFFAIRPTVNTIIGLRKQIEDDQIVDAKLQDKINALSQIQAELDVLQPDLPLIDTALPTKSEVVSLIKSLESLASENNASLSALQIGEALLSETSGKKEEKTVVTDQAIPVSFLFTVEGGYTDIAGLIKRVTNLPRVVTTQNVIILKSSGKIIGSIRFNAFYLPKQ